MSFMVLCALYAALWTLCGLVGGAVTLHNFDRQWPYGNHLGVTLIVALAGPLGLLVALLGSKQVGLRFRFRPVEERYQLWRAKYPTVSPEWFERFWR